MSNIYLDHSATTPVDKKVLEAMMPYFSDNFGNANSIHSFGQAALAGVDKARKQVAKFLNCKPSEIIFTSGATESDNLAIKGVVKALHVKGLEKMHIITTKVEHEAVLEPCKELEKEGIEVTYLPVKKNAEVDLAVFEKAIKDNTVLVSVIYVNSEVGIIEPIREVAKIIKKINEKKLREWEKRRPQERGAKPQPIYFHTDATQAVNFLSCDVQWNFIDLLSLSAHKIYGPKGVGALYVRKGTPIMSLQKGGHHENNLRSGTLNVASIVGLGAAITQIDKRYQETNNARLNKLRKVLIDGLLKNIPGAILNTDLNNSSPSHAHFTFPGAEGESILISLDLEGVAVSTGSACAAGSLEPSHVLLAMGIPAEIAHSSIRFTLGKYNAGAEIKKVIKILPPIIARLRKMNPNYK
ncbi:MAG: Cysteine desulfurase [Parcubacteria group bacterium ADurb.Bin316]|nr:MAG: Cysteine desulfurase [Parcubacteria group bacterium ADurb.Bin316]HOZ55928.1 cysteine desulfurase family protein [bacterium]